MSYVYDESDTDSSVFDCAGTVAVDGKFLTLAYDAGSLYADGSQRGDQVLARVDENVLIILRNALHLNSSPEAALEAARFVRQP